MAEKSPYDHHDVNVLCKAILTLQTEEECLRFLQDLMTIREIRDMSHRLKVAGMAEPVPERTGMYPRSVSSRFYPGTGRQAYY